MYIVISSITEIKTMAQQTSEIKKNMNTQTHMNEWQLLLLRGTMDCKTTGDGQKHDRNTKRLLEHKSEGWVTVVWGGGAWKRWTRKGKCHKLFSCIVVANISSVRYYPTDNSAMQEERTREAQEVANKLSFELLFRSMRSFKLLLLLPLHNAHRTHATRKC